jgi:outer membrane protein assembly factor BamB
MKSIPCFFTFLPLFLFTFCISTVMANPFSIVIQIDDSISGYKHSIRGVVYLDENGNGKKEVGERGISGIAVSDGRDVVLTNDSGAYFLPNIEKKAFFAFVHQSGNFIKSGQNFFHRLLDAGSDEQFNFGLQPLTDASDTIAEGTQFVQLSDSHIRNMSDREYMKQATTEIYNMSRQPDFIVSTGDMVDWGVDEHFENYVAGMQKPPVPYFNIFGNHEIVFGPIERYYDYLGPDYYSFEHKGILYIALNCVTPTERQDEWVKQTLELLTKNRPVVIFQHFPPSLEDLERFGRMGVKSVFTGHWHSEKEMDHAGVQSINSPPFIMGGIDASPAGFKVVHLNADGSAETEWRYGFQNKLLTIVSPQEGVPVSGHFPIIVNTYTTSHNISSVKWLVGQNDTPIDSGYLQQESALSWTRSHHHSHSNSFHHSHTSPHHHSSIDSHNESHEVSHNHAPVHLDLPENNYSLNIEVKDDQGTTWSASREIAVESNNLAAKPSPKGEWHMFMGNAAHTGISYAKIENLPLRLAWSIDIGGEADFSSPILADGRLYLAHKKRTMGRSNGVAAYDPVTGIKLWHFETQMAVNHTPAFSNGVVCIAEMGGRIYGLDAKTGKELWHHDLIDNRGRYNYGAPAVHNGWFYVGVMRRVAKIRPADGHIEWEKQVGRSDNDWISSYGSPAINGNFLAMGGMFFRGETLTIVNTETGSRIWGHNADYGMLASPTIAGDRIYFTSMKSILYAQRLSDGKDLWSRELGAGGTETNELGVATDGNAKWSATTPAVKLNKKNSGIVVAGSGDGHMSGVSIADGKVLWTHVSDSTVFKVSPYRRDYRPLLSSPTIADDKVFFGSSDGHLYCLDLKSGKKLWSFDIGVPVMSTPLVTGNVVYVAAYDGRLYAFTSRK